MPPSDSTSSSGALWGRKITCYLERGRNNTSNNSTASTLSPKLCFTPFTLPLPTTTPAAAIFPTPIPGVPFSSSSTSSYASPLSTLPGPTSIPTHTSLSAAEPSLQPIPTQPGPVPGGFAGPSTSGSPPANLTITSSLNAPSADSGSAPTTAPASHLSPFNPTNSSALPAPRYSDTVTHSTPASVQTMTSTFAKSTFSPPPFATSHPTSLAPTSKSALSTTNSHPGQGTIIGLAVGLAIVGTCLVLALCWYIAERRRQRAARSAPVDPPRAQRCSLRSASVIQVVEADVGASPPGIARRGSNDPSSKSDATPSESLSDVDRDLWSGRGNPEDVIVDEALSDVSGEWPGADGQAVVRM